MVVPASSCYKCCGSTSKSEVAADPDHPHIVSDNNVVEVRIRPEYTCPPDRGNVLTGPAVTFDPGRFGRAPTGPAVVPMVRTDAPVVAVGCVGGVYRGFPGSSGRFVRRAAPEMKAGWRRVRSCH